MIVTVIYDNQEGSILPGWILNPFLADQTWHALQELVAEAVLCLAAEGCRQRLLGHQGLLVCN